MSEIENWDLALMNEAGALAVAELRAELDDQGHNASGQLSESMEYNWGIQGDDLVVSVSFLDYGEYVDRGRRPGTKRVPIAALMDWIRQRRFEADGEESIRRIAFAIQETIYQHGIPTPGSLKFSRTRKRDEFVEIASGRILIGTERIIESKILKYFEGIINSLIEQN